MAKHVTTPLMCRRVLIHYDIYTLRKRVPKWFSLCPVLWIILKASQCDPKASIWTPLPTKNVRTLKMLFEYLKPCLRSLARVLPA